MPTAASLLGPAHGHAHGYAQLLASLAWDLALLTEVVEVEAVDGDGLCCGLLVALPVALHPLGNLPMRLLLLLLLQSTVESVIERLEQAAEASISSGSSVGSCRTTMLMCRAIFGVTFSRSSGCRPRLSSACKRACGERGDPVALGMAGHDLGCPPGGEGLGRRRRDAGPNPGGEPDISQLRSGLFKAPHGAVLHLRWDHARGARAEKSRG